MLARDRLSLSTMSHLLVKVFFGYGERILVVTALFFSLSFLTDHLKQIECSWISGLVLFFFFFWHVH